MSLAAAQAMDDLAEAIEAEAQSMSRRDGREIMAALARAHRTTAGKIRARAGQANSGPVPVPPEYREAGAGQKATPRE